MQQSGTHTKWCKVWDLTPFMCFLPYSWRVNPPPCSITRLGIDSLSLRNDELRVREQGHCTNKTKLLLNEWLVQGGWDICSQLFMWRQIKQVRSSCWMKTHPPFELPPHSFTWSVKWGGVAIYCVPDDWAMKIDSFCTGFSHVDECNDMFPCLGHDTTGRDSHAFRCRVTGSGKPLYRAMKNCDSCFKVLSAQA